jgi:hypothetical protein
MRKKQEDLVAEAFREVQLELRQAHSQSVQDSVGIYFAKLRDRIGELLSTDSQKFDRESFDRACDPDAEPQQPRMVHRSRVAYGPHFSNP